MDPGKRAQLVHDVGRALHERGREEVLSADHGHDRFAVGRQLVQALLRRAPTPRAHLRRIPCDRRRRRRRRHQRARPRPRRRGSRTASGLPHAPAIRASRDRRWRPEERRQAGTPQRTDGCADVELSGDPGTELGRGLRFRKCNSARRQPCSPSRRDGLGRRPPACGDRFRVLEHLGRRRDRVRFAARGGAVTNAGSMALVSSTLTASRGGAGGAGGSGSGGQGHTGGGGAAGAAILNASAPHLPTRPRLNRGVAPLDQ